MRRNLKHILLALGAVALVLLIVLRSMGRQSKAEAGREMEVPIAAVNVVKRTSLVQKITLSGAFRPYQEVDVHAKVAGYISRIFVDVGDKTREGQVLALLEVPELSAQVSGARAGIQRSKDSIARNHSEVKRAESSHQAYHTAYTRLKQAAEARPGLIAEQELDDALAKDQESEAQIESARAALAESKSQLAGAEADFSRFTAMESYSRITAPFTGVITKRYADTGALIQAGTSSNTQAMPIVRLAEWSKMRLVVPVPESDVPTIHLGSAVQVRVASLNRTFEGKVARFSDALDPQTRTMETEIDVENRDGRLVDGMYAETTLVLNDKENVLTVPIQALQRDSSGGTILVVDRGGTVEERRVTTGEEGNDRIEITSGLAENDAVIVGNRNEFKAGEKVQPKPVQAQKVEASL